MNIAKQAKPDPAFGEISHQTLNIDLNAKTFWIRLNGHLQLTCFCVQFNLLVRRGINGCGKW
jgi:hypothetical protein